MKFKYAKRKVAVGNVGTEEYERLKAVIMTRAETRAQADALFDADAKKMRQNDTALLEKLFLQAPAAQTMAPNLQKNAEVFGEVTPDEIEHASIPYGTRKAMYTDYLKAKSKERPTGTGKAGLTGGAIGGGLGALMGGLATRSATGAGVGGALGAGTGALIGVAAALADAGRIDEAKEILKSRKIDQGLARDIASVARARELKKDMQHYQTINAIHSINKYSSVSAVDAYFATLSAPDEAQRRYPELMKAAGARSGDPSRPAVNLKTRKATEDSGTDPVRSGLSGGST